MRTSANILFCIIVLALSACGGGSFEKRLSALDSVLKDKPDSIYQLLLGMEEEAMTQNKAGRMYYELLRADAQNKAYVDFTTDSVMRIVADYYDRHGSANEQMRAHYLLGCTYRDLKDVPMELQCFQDAVEKADTTKADCDLYTLTAIYGQMADIYDNQHLPEEELKTLKICEQLSLQDKDTLTAVKAFELRLRAFFLLNNQDSVLAISKEAYNRYNKLGYPEKAARLLNPAIDILVKQKQYDEAWKYLHFYESHVKSSKYEGTYKNTAIINHVKGLLLLKSNKIDSALSCFNTLLSVDEKEAAYHGLLSLYQKTNEPDSIAKYAKLFAATNDSTHIYKNSETIAQMTAMYNYGRQEKIAKMKTIESAEAKATIYVISIIAIAVLFALSIVNVVLRHRAKERERIHREQEKILLNRYNETNGIIYQLEQEKESLKADSILNEQLVQKIKKYEQEKLELETKLKEVSQITDDVDFKAWYESFIDCNAANKLHAKTIISPNYVIEIEDELWDELCKQIKKHCPAFLNIIDSYSLNQTHYKIVLLNTFDFTNSEISILLDKTTQQISNIHNSISKKIFPSCKETRKLKQNIQQILREKRVHL